MLQGILAVNKPSGITSHDVIYKLRKILKIKKMGHTGTLDPVTTGVLPVCIGKSTRLIQYLPTDKKYFAKITLGITTSTYDTEGEILSKIAVKATTEDINRTLNSFKGTIVQEVPLTSATHYKGKKLYEYAHKGITIEDLPKKAITVYSLDLLKIDISTPDNPVISIDVHCSSGTYIRSIANELGKKLGCGAFLSQLIRTEACNIKLEQSKTLEDIEKAYNKNTLDSFILSPVNILPLDKHYLNNEETKKISHGQNIPTEKDSQENKTHLSLLGEDNQLIGIGEYLDEEKIIKPKLVLIQY